jgi:hypothetical protein
LKIVTCIIEMMHCWLNRTSLTTWYRVVGAYMLLAREKYMVEKFIISLHVNASAIHPSTFALL